MRGLMYVWYSFEVKMMSRVNLFSTIVFSVKFCIRWYPIHLTQSNGLEIGMIFVIVEVL